MPYDFNGDGYRDLAASGPTGTVGAVKAAGYVAVVYGSASGVNTAKRQVISQDSPGVPGGAETGDGFGWGGLTSADFDNDGYADLAVGAPFEKLDVTNAGLVAVIFGSASGLSGQAVGLNLPSGQQAEDDHFGEHMAAGDFNRDGRTDLAVASEKKRAYFTYSFTAQRTVVAGPTAKTPQNRFMDIATGDVDGDGCTDLATVTNSYDSASRNTVRLFRGGTSGLAASAYSTVDAGAWSGQTSLAAGDVNGDGRSDVILGDLYETVNGVKSAGQVVSYYGGADGIASSRRTSITQATPGVAGAPEDSDLFGSSVATGDINKDGFADVAVGVEGESIDGTAHAGMATVLYGTQTGLSGTGSQSFSQNDTVGAPEKEDYMGSAVTLLDFDNNGQADLGVGVQDENGRDGGVQVLKATGGRITGTGAIGFTGSGVGANPTGALLGLFLGH
ncbi:FG-GAP-like repeat-containing protein [Streptomyces sp. NPDC004111]|uniref:FG-GAP-like repeat-containing protein n=1 Tax=Streptomyces sp. NPDC004111 TaxID=3364690 RepID=UPI0036804661